MDRRTFSPLSKLSTELNRKQAGGSYTFVVLVTCSTLIALGHTLFGPAQQTLKINYLRQHKVAGQHLIRSGIIALQAQEAISVGKQTIELKSGTVLIEVRQVSPKLLASITGIPKESRTVTGPRTSAEIVASMVKAKINALESIEFSRLVNVPKSELESPSNQDK